MIYKAAIFDFDGVLNDSERLKFDVWQSILAEERVKIDEQFFKKECCGKPVEILAPMLVKKYSLKMTTEYLREQHVNRSAKALTEAVKPIKENIDFLKYCCRRFNGYTALATSQWPSILNPSIEKLRIRQYLKEIVNGLEIAKGKPAPDIYLRAYQKLGLKPEECIVIEDSEIGITSAYNSQAGLIIAIPGEFTRLQNFSKADIIVGTGVKHNKNQKHVERISDLLKGNYF